jgi:GTP-binding protein HflX
VFVSARTGQGLDALLERTAAMLPPSRREMRLLLPYAMAGFGTRLRAEGRVDKEEFREEGVYYEAAVPPRLAEELRAYIIG